MTLPGRDESMSRYQETQNDNYNTSLPRITPQSPAPSLARSVTTSSMNLLWKCTVTETPKKDSFVAAPVLLPNSASSIYTLSTSETYPCQKAAALPPRNFDLQHEFLRIIEPSPVEPPSYDSLVPGGCPRFPTYGNIPEPHGLISSPLESCALLQLPTSDLSIEPPTYSPSVYKLTVVIRKIEWLTPFEAAPIRTWKCHIMELNSTQLNFYLIPSKLKERVLRCFADPASHSSKADAKDFADEINARKSGLTTDVDINFYRLCRRLNLIPNPNMETSGRRLGTLRLRGSLQVSKRLIRSYSLQHATVGLATDYIKRKNVLRARLESEQFLLHFHDTQDLIDWEVALGVGSGIALDIVDRELPQFRTVPRRRRRRGLSDMCEYTSGAFSTEVGTSFRRRGLTGGLIAGSFRCRMLDICAQFNTSTKQQVSQNQLRITQPYHANNSEITESADSPVLYPRPEINPIGQLIDCDAASDDDDDYSILDSSLTAAVSNDSSGPPITSQQTISGITMAHGSQLIEASSIAPSWDNQCVEEEKDEYADTQELLEDDSWIEQSAFSGYNTSELDDFKWDPLANLQPSKRKVHRNCLRCIRTLSNYDPWVNKCVVKPTVISPFIFNYLNFMRVDSDSAHKIHLAVYSRDKSTSAASLPAYADPDKSPHILRALGRLNIFAGKDRLQKKGLAQMPSHYVREYVVGSHVLIPKVLNV